MNKRLFFIIIVLPLHLICCQKETKKADVEREISLIETLPDTISEEPKSPKEPVAVPLHVDDNFELFISIFNANTEFQLSRIKFPLKTKVWDGNLDVVEEVLQKEDYTILFLDLEDSSDYNTTVIESENEGSIEYIGIENGIMADYFFEKIKGEWYLVGYVNVST